MTRPYTRNEPVQTLRRVRLDRPGVHACGPYRAGTDYDVPEEQAAHLVAHKGFRYVDTDAATAAPMNTEEH